MAPAHVNSTTLRRIHREIADLKKEDLGTIALAPSDDLFHWNATIPGPEGSVYEGGVFQVDITLGHDYPFSAPRVMFKTRIYHMNINERGSICIDILKHNWSPALSLFKVILSLSSLLTDPNPKDPLVPSIATEYVRNRVQHDHNARRWTELYAHPPPPPPSQAANGKGKAPAGATHAASTPIPTASASASASQPPSTRPAQTRTEPITIEDDSDEEAPRAGARAVAARRAKRKREPDGAARPGAHAVDIDLSEEPEEGEEVRPARRARTGAGEVIVIED